MQKNWGIYKTRYTTVFLITGGTHHSRPTFLINKNSGLLVLAVQVPFKTCSASFLSPQRFILPRKSASTRSVHLVTNYNLSLLSVRHYGSSTTGFANKAGWAVTEDELVLRGRRSGGLDVRRAGFREAEAKQELFCYKREHYNATSPRISVTRFRTEMLQIPDRMLTTWLFSAYFCFDGPTAPTINTGKFMINCFGGESN